MVNHTTRLITAPQWVWEAESYDCFRVTQVGSLPVGSLKGLFVGGQRIR